MYLAMKILGGLSSSLDQRNNGEQIIVTGYIPFDVNDTDVFIVKLDNQGFPINDGWRSLGSEIELGTGINFDNSGSIVLTGHFYNELNIPGTIEFIYGNLNEIFIAKYTNDINPIWYKSAGSNGLDAGGSVTVDGNNNIFITGLCEKPCFIWVIYHHYKWRARFFRR